MPVDTLDPTWINAPGGVGPSYDSEELRRNQAFTIARGTTPGSARAGILAVGDLALSLSGMNVRLGAGGCVVATAKGAYVTGFAATTTVDALQAADVTNPRRDRVVIEILDPDNGGAAGRKGQARVITGTPNASAATGGGYPAEPSGPVLTIGHVDMPKSGAGSPVLTMTAPYTAAAGAPIPVRNVTEMNALPKRNGDQCIRLDLGGDMFTCNGSAWLGTAHAEFIGPIVTTAPGSGTTPGNLSRDNSVPTNSSFVQADVAGSLKVLVSGVYAGGFMVYPSTAAGEPQPGKSTAIVMASGVEIGRSVGGDYGGVNFGAVIMPKYLPAGTVIGFSLATTTGVKVGSRVTLTRIG